MQMWIFWKVNTCIVSQFNKIDSSWVWEVGITRIFLCLSFEKYTSDKISSIWLYKANKLHILNSRQALNQSYIWWGLLIIIWLSAVVKILPWNLSTLSLLSFISTNVNLFICGYITVEWPQLHFSFLLNRKIFLHVIT